MTRVQGEAYSDYQVLSAKRKKGTEIQMNLILNSYKAKPN